MGRRSGATVWGVVLLAAVALPAHSTDGESTSAAAAPVVAQSDHAQPLAAPVRSTVPTGASTDAELAPIVVYAQKLTALWKKNLELDESRDQELLPKLGATTYDITQEGVETLPQGKNTPIDKVLLQAPGVSYDSAVSNPDFHIRNEYSNVQYRINGIQLPDGVSALGPVLETGFMGNLQLLDGALPAEYGLRTAGVVDIATKSAFDPGGNLDVYAGSLGTVSPSIEYGGSAGRSEYYLTGRYLQSDEGLENAMPTVEPLHDRTTQEKFFGYASTVFDDSDRLTTMAGAWVGHFQIPDVVGLMPLGDFGSGTLSSASLDEKETDRFYFAIVALQTQHENIDTQLSLFTRYASVDFLPDVYGDLAFDDVASAVARRSQLSGLQFDAADHFGNAHTLRAGFAFSAEQTRVDDLSTVLPLGADGSPLPTPLTLNDYTAKLGWNLGAYAQDEWLLRPNLTLNVGARFDQMQQFVTANQFSPRFALIYKPASDTSIHAGISRYFTPPQQAQATPNNLALFRNTTQQPSIALDDPVQPERSTYVDVGVDQQLRPGLSVGADLYYKHATDALDDGQFGQAVVLDQYNYARGFSRGVEFKLNYQRGGLRAYSNLSAEVTQAKQVDTNQYLIGDPVEFAYLASHYTYTSDAQTVTASAGASYRSGPLLASIDGIYGSGLRAGFANLDHSPGYTQWNAALTREFDPWHTGKLLSLRFSAINLFDRSYVLRSGTGIGEFAPQYGPRRGLFVEVSQRF